ncbi:outer membrane beta-barrel protein [Brevundimonas sp. SL130]|uniref:outer membrane beta-barrel protein n=1 Tax=Brevundimonas sp. SL130 TaxID=2995143 RepID=UPI00226C99B7|nr:outer membrane beta-barrel protein [Brevundimonas sp. SL130]WAC59211.1 outer membrane beta-barrel protein [Brevundimonas sp. SL130]
MRFMSSNALLRAGAASIVAVGAVATAGETAAQSSIASAQRQSVDMFARDRGVGVRERARPEYEALGLGAGAFTIFPKLQLDAEYNDNVFASETDEQDDFIFRIRPEVLAESDWSRHSLQAYARSVISRNADFDSEDTTDWTVGTRGRLDVVRGSSVSGGAEYGHLTEPRSSTNTAQSSVDPIEYDLASAYVGAVRAKGRVRVSGRADLKSWDYEDGETAAGDVIDQSARNRTNFALAGRVDYALSPATALFGMVTGNERDYDSNTSTTTPARDSSGVEALVGVNFELGAVSRGEVAAGYISQSYDNAAYTDIDGFGGRAQLEWFPTELTTVTANVSRTIEDAGIIGSAGYLSSEVGGKVDHELLRNLILTGQLTYSKDDYNAIDRDDQRVNASMAATYLLNRNYGVTTTLSYLDLSSDGVQAGPSYAVTRLFVALVAQF